MLPLRDFNPTRRSAVVTFLLIAANVGVYFLVQPANDDLSGNARFNYETAAIPCELSTGEALSPDEISAALQGGELCREGDRPYFPDKSVWLAVLYSMFFHGGLAHLGGNMLFLWIFGNNIEDHLGHLRFLLFYVASGVVATLAHVVFNLDSTIPIVGASGAIAGVMGAYLVWFPNARILGLVFILLTTIAAKWFLAFWFVSQFFVDPNSGVASLAHVGGFVFGVAGALLVRRSRPARQVLVRDRYVDDWR